ncbi:MAG: hypothetical protein HGB01_02665 [Chlorobiaceae bacterium]|nr:hypothetical protein [Chlorobiaceae bacterium]
MKKMLSLAAMCAVLSYAAPASAELKFGGDASVRVRDENFYGDTVNKVNPTTGETYKKSSDLKWQYRVRFNAAADLGNGYYFKALVTDETADADAGGFLTGGVPAGGWRTVGYGNGEAYKLEVSNFYFGRNLENCHYALGRLPLGSFNNPVFDLTLYPNQPLENPVANINMDRVYGANYGTKIGSGMMNATIVMLDDNSWTNTSNSGDGKFNDGYGLLLSYKFNLGNVTVEPMGLAVLTNTDIWDQRANPVHSNVTPYTVGAMVGVPAGSAKLSFGGFYTHCNDTTDEAAVTGIPGSKVKYDGYQFRVKGEVGKFMAWYDYNHTTDKSDFYGANAINGKMKSTNHFVWAQYKIPVYESAAGTFSIQPTVRYLATKVKDDVATSTDLQRLRTELWATVTF